MTEQKEQGITGMINSVPGLRQGMLLAGLAASVALGLWMVFWSQEPGFKLLYANLAERDAGSVVQALQSAGIEYKIDDTAGSIRVPAQNLHEARLQMAAQGLPGSGGVGLEMIQSESGITVSQFMEGARYQHALETELARTIVSMRPVERARVHLAIPRQTVFLRDRHPPSASVLVHLYPGRSLEGGQVQAIVNLLASSIPEMQTTGITVVDQNGRLLNAPGDNEELAATSRQYEQRKRLEEDFSQRIESMLSAILGPGRVRATVAADLDFTVSEETRESYDPSGNVLRSEQTSEDVRRDASSTVGGVPGSASNQPRAAAPGQEAKAEPMTESRNATRNYELDRTVSHVRNQLGEIKNLSVAVLIDHQRSVNEEGDVIVEPLSEQKLDEVRSLVREMVGFNEERGDSVSVINASFQEQPAVEKMPAASMLEAPWLQSLLRQVAAVVVVLVLLFSIVRPVMKSLLAPPPAAPWQGQVMMGTAGAGMQNMPPPEPSYDERIAAARAMANKDPQRVAQVVKDWVGNES